MCVDAHAICKEDEIAGKLHDLSIMFFRSLMRTL